MVRIKLKKILTFAGLLGLFSLNAKAENKTNFSYNYNNPKHKFNAQIFDNSDLVTNLVIGNGIKEAGFNIPLSKNDRFVFQYLREDMLSESKNIFDFQLNYDKTLIFSGNYEKIKDENFVMGYGGFGDKRRCGNDTLHTRIVVGGSTAENSNLSVYFQQERTYGQTKDNTKLISFGIGINPGLLYDVNFVSDKYSLNAEHYSSYNKEYTGGMLTFKPKTSVEELTKIPFKNYEGAVGIKNDKRYFYALENYTPLWAYGKAVLSYKENIQKGGVYDPLVKNTSLNGFYSFGKKDFAHVGASLEEQVSYRRFMPNISNTNAYADAGISFKWFDFDYKTNFNNLKDINLTARIKLKI